MQEVENRKRGLRQRWRFLFFVFVQNTGLVFPILRSTFARPLRKGVIFSPIF